MDWYEKKTKLDAVKKEIERGTESMKISISCMSDEKVELNKADAILLYLIEKGLIGADTDESFPF